MARLRIGLIGWGTVGSALGRLVSAGPLPLELACVAVRNAAAARGIPLPDGVAVVAPEDVVAAHLDSVVELAGGTEEPLAWARTALAAGTPYVTPNKAPLAILASEAWGEWRSESQVERHGIRGLEVGEGQVIRLVAEATEDRLAVTPLEVEPDTALAAVSGIENLLEIDVRAGGIFRISGP